MNHWRLKESARIGIRHGPKIWLSTLRNIDNLRDSIGLRYTFKVKVAYNDTYGTIKEAEGLLWKYDDDPPYNIVLRARYLAVCNSRDLLIRGLARLDNLLENYNKDKKYREKLQDYLHIKSDVYDSLVEDALRSRLLSAESISSELDKIDFSRFVEDLIRGLNLPIQLDYGEHIFISAANIVSLEIVRLDTRFVIKLYDQIPSTGIVYSVLLPISIPLTDEKVKLK